MQCLFLKRMRLACAGLALGLASCNSMFYYPSRHSYGDPGRLGIAYVDRFFTTGSGVNVHGRVFRHMAGRPYRGLFVLFHGNAQNLTAHYLQLAWVLHRGYDLFVFDYPGYGASGGEATRAGTLESGAAALALVSDSLLPKPPGKLVLVGASLGGAVLLRNFSDWKGRDKATLVVAESTFPYYRVVARSSLSKHWSTWPLQPLSFALISDRDAPGPFIPLIAPTPMLVATCREDAVVDPRFSREVYARAAEPKWFWEFSGCGHIQAFKSRDRQDKLMALVDSLGT